MNQKTGQRIFILFNILAFFFVGFVVYDFLTVISGVNERKSEIYFDSAVYYFLLASIFWVFYVIQFAGLKNEKSQLVKYASQISIVWFIFILMLANILPWYLEDKFSDAGYHKCKNPLEISHLGRGESTIYRLSQCE